MFFNYALTDAQLYSWGWRIPFWISILGAGVGTYVRRSVSEPPKYEGLMQLHLPAASNDMISAPVGERPLVEQGVTVATSSEEDALLLREQSEQAGRCDIDLVRDVKTRAVSSPWDGALVRRVYHSRWCFMALGIVTVFFIDFLTAVGFYLIVIFCPVYFQVKVGYTG